MSNAILSPIDATHNDRYMAEWLEVRPARRGRRRNRSVKNKEAWAAYVAETDAATLKARRAARAERRAKWIAECIARSEARRLARQAEREARKARNRYLWSQECRKAQAARRDAVDAEWREWCLREEMARERREADIFV